MPLAPARLRRFACMMYEGVLLFGVVFLAAYLFDTLSQSRHALMLRPGRQLFIFLAIGLYFWFSWRRNGQTLPMKTWHIRVTDRGGRALQGYRLLLRYLLLWPLPLLTAWLIGQLASYSGQTSLDLLVVLAPFSIFIWSWFDPQGQFLHDRILGTELHDLRTHNHDR